MNGGHGFGGGRRRKTDRRARRDGSTYSQAEECARPGWRGGERWRGSRKLGLRGKCAVGGGGGRPPETPSPRRRLRWRPPVGAVWEVPRPPTAPSHPGPQDLGPAFVPQLPPVSGTLSLLPSQVDSRLFELQAAYVCTEPPDLWGWEPEGSPFPLLLLTAPSLVWPPNPALPPLAGSVRAPRPVDFRHHSFWLTIFLHFLVSLWHPFQQ